jgi:hypothetical protein
MKSNLTFILFLLLIPMISLSQSESDQKRQKRFERYPRTNFITPNPYISPYYNPYYNPYIPYYNNRYTHLTPYYGLPATPPARRERKTIISIGTLSTFNMDYTLPTLGGYTTIGSESVFFKISYEGSAYDVVHYNNIKLSEVNSWGDTYVNQYDRYTSLFSGIGVRLGRSIYPFAGLNFHRITNNLVYLDNSYILSNNGLYSIRGSHKDGLNFRGGILFRRGVFEIGTHIIIPHPMRVGLNVGFSF